jgi:hypothetical protein
MPKGNDTNKILFVLGATMLLFLSIGWGVTNRIRIKQLEARVDALEARIKAEIIPLNTFDEPCIMDRT